MYNDEEVIDSEEGYNIDDVVDDSDNSELLDMLTEVPLGNPIPKEKEQSGDTKKINEINEVNEIRHLICLTRNAAGTPEIALDRVKQFFGKFMINVNEGYLANFLNVLREEEFKFYFHEIAHKFQYQFLIFLNEIKYRHEHSAEVFSYLQNCFETIDWRSNPISLSKIIAKHIEDNPEYTFERFSALIPVPIDFPKYVPFHNEKDYELATKFINYARYVCSATEPVASEAWLSCMNSVIERVRDDLKQQSDLKNKLFKDIEGNLSSKEDFKTFVENFIVNPEEYICFMEQNTERQQFFQSFQSKFPRLFLNFLEKILDIPLAVNYVTGCFDKDYSDLLTESATRSITNGYSECKTIEEAQDWVNSYFGCVTTYVTPLESVFRWLADWPQLLVDFVEKAGSDTHWPILENAILQSKSLPRLLSDSLQGRDYFLILFYEILTQPDEDSFNKWSPFIKIYTSSCPEEDVCKIIEAVRTTSNETASDFIFSWPAKFSHSLASTSQGQEYISQLAQALLSDENPDDRWITFVDRCCELIDEKRIAALSRFGLMSPPSKSPDSENINISSCPLR